MEEEYYALRCKGHIEYVRDCFVRLLQSNDFCDVTLYAEGRKIGAHKVMLIASSGYFSELFEELNDERPFIVLKGVRFDIICEILRFIYEGQVNIERAKLTDFLETAKFLKILGLISDTVARKRTNSLISETDNTTNIGDGETHMLQPDRVSKRYLVSDVYHSPSITEDRQHNRSELSLTDRLPKTKRYSLVSDTDPSLRTTKNRQYDHQSKAEVSPAEILSETKQYSLITEAEYSPRTSEGQQYNQQNKAAQTLHEAKGHGFLQGKCFLPKPSTRVIRLDNQANQTALNLAVETKKYTLESPPRIGEWTSDYENHSQSVQSTADIMMEEVDLDYDSSTINSGNIKSESPVPSLEEEKEIVPFNLNFASSPNAEIVLSDDDDDNSDDCSLEKEMLKTSLTSVLKGGFQCNICNKIYVKKDSLKKHFTMHTRNTTCMICGMTLSRRIHLQRHMKIHEIIKRK